MTREHEPGRAEDAVRRPVAGRLDAGCCADDVSGTSQVFGDVPGRATQQQGVPVAVDGDLVPRGHEICHERGPALDLLSDEEERGAHICALELLEHGRRSVGMRPVVISRDAATFPNALTLL